MSDNRPPAIHYRPSTPIGIRNILLDFDQRSAAEQIDILQAIRECAQDMIDDRARELVAHGWPYERLGQTLGISKQAAHKRYRKSA